jgi:rubrerythrin
MTREEAIRMLKAKLECMTRDVSGSDDDCNRKLCGECHLNYEQGNMGEQKEYIRMSIEALEREPCEDAISRQAVLIELDKYLSGVSFDEKGIDVVIKELPPVSPQPKMGRWSHDGSHWKNRFICSECGYKLFDEPTSYCPNCGAKMAESEGKE